MRRRSARIGSHTARHAPVASTRSRGADHPALPSYLAPKRQRRAYGDKGLATTGARSTVPASTAPVGVNQFIGAMLRSHALDWASTQRDNCRTYLLSPTGRFQQWCMSVGIATVDALTTAAVADFLAAVGDRRHGAGLKPATVAKYRIHLRALARFQAQTPGYGDGLADIHRIPAPRMPTERLVLALSRQEEEQVLAACTTTRDRLIIELLLATGVRVSELAALTMTNLLLTARPPRVLVVGSVHDPDCTKGRRPRQVPFRSAYTALPRRLSEWISNERDPSGLCRRQELFLGRRPGEPSRAASPLNIWGFESLCQRVSLRAGIHFSPHVLRHTWATRMVDAGVQPVHMMAVGGWSSIEMVRRYYTPDTDEILAAIAAAGA
ncbi:MAG TPA: site-specific integrase [Candidatus Dormibacteraeota bacterium]